MPGHTLGHVALGQVGRDVERAVQEARRGGVLRLTLWERTSPIRWTPLSISVEDHGVLGVEVVGQCGSLRCVDVPPNRRVPKYCNGWH